MPPDKWGYNEAEKMMCDVLIVDEFSMVDLRLFKHIIDAIDFKRTKLLMIGDNHSFRLFHAGIYFMTLCSPK